jgi:hypothetical protein
MTLFNCQVIGATLPLFGNNGQLKIWPKLLAYDLHFTDVDDFRLTTLWVRYSNLDAWGATFGFSIDLGRADILSTCVKYTRPETVEFGTVDGLTISVAFSASGPTITPSQTQVHIEQAAWVKVTSADPRPYEELMRTAAVFSDLITLGVGQPVRPIEFEAECNTQTDGRPAAAHLKLIHNRNSITPVLPDTDVWDMLFTLPDVRDRLSSLLHAWFERRENIKPLYDLYFGTVRSPSMYVEHRFLNMFQALESYDRRTYVQDSEKVKLHQERLERISKAVDSTDRKWLKARLKHSHEPAAADRIRRLVARVHADWLLDDNQITLAGDFRNFYTHFDPGIEQRLPPNKERPRSLHNLAIRLQILCEITLLDAIDFPTRDVRQRMDKIQRLERRLAC